MKNNIKLRNHVARIGGMLLRILVISVFLAGMFAFIEIKPESVKATPGSVTVNITRGAVGWQRAYNTYKTWTEICSKDIAQTGESTICTTGLDSWAGADLYIYVKGYLQFDWEGYISELDSIKSIKLFTYAKRTYTGDYPVQSITRKVGIYPLVNDEVGVQLEDWNDVAENMRLSDDIYSWMDLDSDYAWYTWEFKNSMVEDIEGYLDDNGIFVIYLSMLSEVSGSTPTADVENPEYIDLSWDSTGYGGESAYLQVEYLPDISSFERPEVTPETNDPVDTEISGNETASDIIWRTPRCLYLSDEYASIAVVGDSGANVTLGAFTEDNVQLDTITDSIRTNGYFYWTFPLPTEASYIRVYEYNHHLNSTWGYVAENQSPTIEWLHTYSKYSEYPQYSIDFDNYRLKENEAGMITWLLNMETADQPACNLKILADDYSTQIIMNETFETLVDDYYQCTKDEYKIMAFDSYLLYCPNITSGSFKTYDGLILNMAKNYGDTWVGFWSPVIEYNGSVIVDCHSAFYFMHDADEGVTISAQAFNDGLQVYITFGEQTKINDYLMNMEVDLYDNTDTLFATTDEVLKVGMNRCDLPPLTEEGNYKIRFTCSSDLCPDYSYIYDWSFSAMTGGTVTTTTPGSTGQTPPGWTNWRDWFRDLIKRAGLDNEAGHWLIIFILCVIWVIFLRKNALALTVMIMLTVGAGLIFQWLNPWFYVLLAIGAGILIFSLFKKKTQGSKDDT